MAENHPDFFYNVPPYKHKIPEDVAPRKRFEMCCLENNPGRRETKPAHRGQAKNRQPKAS